MVRRRVPKSRAHVKSKPRSLDKNESKVKKWNKRSDIPLDEEDEFHANKDRILLNGGGDDDDDYEEDEVFGLNGVSDEDEDEDEGMGMAVDDEDEGEDDDDDEEEYLSVAVKATKTSKGGKQKQKASLDEESDDEEVDESWGKKTSAFYSSNAKELDSEDEEANELEEQEARRLQAKAREGMTDADFGLEDVHDVTTNPDDDDLVEAPVVQLAHVGQDKKSLLRHLEKTNPLALALARDWDDTAQNLIRTKAKLDKIEAEDSDALSLGMMHLHYQALLTYANTLAFYLYLRASDKYARQPKLLDSHPITNRLLTLKQSLATLEDLDFAASDSDEEADSSDINEEEMWSDANQLWGAGQDGNLEAGELDDLLLDAQSEPEQTLGEHRSRLRASNKASREEEEPPTKKRKTSKTKSVKAAPPVFDLVEPEFPASQSTRSSRRASQEDDSQNMFGELSSLDHADAVDKTARKKSLRFHTSKIESATARRQGARSRALGGDDDIPYKERRKEKNARLEAQADKGLRGQGGADLDDAEPSPRDADVDMEDANGYYELVKKTSKAKKELKKAEHDASAAAARAHVEENGVDGPRSLTRAILSNKGLTPHRPKSVRNPRVKKRQKFEKAKRKVASQKAVYKGGLNATGGRYDGEKTGISKVVKSIRLS